MTSIWNCPFQKTLLRPHLKACSFNKFIHPGRTWVDVLSRWCDWINEIGLMFCLDGAIESMKSSRGGRSADADAYSHTNIILVSTINSVFFSLVFSSFCLTMRWASYPSCPRRFSSSVRCSSWCASEELAGVVEGTTPSRRGFISMWLWASSSAQ
jgi:hypothetical protein